MPTSGASSGLPNGKAYRLFETPEPISRMTEWASVVDKFTHVAGSSLLGHVFLVNQTTGRYAVLHPARGSYVEYGRFRSAKHFARQVLDHPQFVDTVLLPAHLAAVAAVTGRLRVTQIYAPAGHLLNSQAPPDQYRAMDLWEYLASVQSSSQALEEQPATASPRSHRMAAFSTSPVGGAPTAVVLDTGSLDEGGMLALAGESGCDTTVFCIPIDAGHQLRFFGRTAETGFRVHGTVAVAVALTARLGHGPHTFDVDGNELAVVTRDLAGHTLASVPVHVDLHLLPQDDSADVLDSFSLGGVKVHAVVGVVATAGEKGILVVLDRPEDLRQLVAAPVAQTIWFTAESGPDTFEMRVLSDSGELPASGIGAAALGAFLRTQAPEALARLSVQQGGQTGRSAFVTVDVPARGPLIVSGTAAFMTSDEEVL
ncbi:hypothetical protein BH09ACT5_BH09ACT5_08470 [soil metagenome]